jgi:uncharacterized protein YqjF (DUF2071 family)
MARRTAEQHVSVPTLRAAWLAVTFIHWRVPTEQVQTLLPKGLTVDEYDGSAWIGLTPFVLADMRPFGLPLPRLPRLPGLDRLHLPDITSTPETNLRTYVRDADGRDGLWFLSLDIGNPAVAAALRAAVGAPYNVGRLVLDQTADLITYTGSRVGTPQSYRITVRPGADLDPSDLETWLTSRWRAYTRHLGRLLLTPVEHEPWPLRAATVEILEENLSEPLGLGRFGEPPLVHFSEGAHHVRVGVPRPLRR